MRSRQQAPQPQLRRSEMGGIALRGRYLVPCHCEQSMRGRRSVGGGWGGCPFAHRPASRAVQCA
ncbi:MAG: hypothetical protein HXK18_01500 [Alloprevotella tannerae]|nr:hypothetical protein [Alloprevotella tannerae]